jgi:hypothetical protein
MLLSCRPGTSLWIPVVIVALAILAMSPRLLLQPRCFSFFFLGLTLYLLHRPRPADQAWPRHLFLLPLLFALWVNLDSWFLLGPLTVGLYLVGQLIQQRTAPGTPGESAPQPGETRQLAIILVAGLVACLINPFHVRAFTLPEELWAWMSAGEWLRADPQLQTYLYSPLKSTYITNPGLGLNPTGLAFYALILLGVVSFFLPGVSWSWGRLLLWLVFALLSLALARAIPFFAVVGGVIAALNWQDFSAHRFGVQPSLEPRRKTWSLLGRVATLVGGLALLALAWPGWLNPRPEQARLAHRTHRVAWSIETEPSLRAAALKLADLRANQVLAEGDHGFNFAPDVANYCAWFCPQQKGFFDYRFRLFRDVMGTFLDVREALASRPDGLLLANADWPTLFREQHINHVIVYNDRDIMLIVQHFWAVPKQWTMLYADGRTAIFGWTDPEKPSAAQRLRDHAVNWHALAFGPQPPPEARVPAEDLEEGKARTPDFPEPVSWWTRYAKGPIPRPLAVDEAALYRTWFDFSTLQREVNAKNAAIQLLGSRWITSWMGPNLTALHGLYNLALDRADTQSRGRFLFLRLIEAFYRAQDKSPSPGPLLAIRAARRAVAANPQDPDAYVELGLAYQMIWKHQEERSHSPQLQQLRQIQAGTALQNALLLRPDAPGLHLVLANLYQEMPVQLFLDQPAQPGTAFFDLVVEHRREYIRLRRAAGPPPLPPSDEAKDPQKAMENFVRSLEKDERDLKKFETDIDFAKRQSEYERLAANKSPLEKARLAVSLGLVKQALDVLAQEQSELPEEAKELRIRLHLATG